MLLFSSQAINDVLVIVNKSTAPSSDLVLAERSCHKTTCTVDFNSVQLSVYSSTFHSTGVKPSLAVSVKFYQQKMVGTNRH